MFMSNFLSFLSFLSFSLLSAQVAFSAAEDDYLKQLEMEAGDDVIESPEFLESQGSKNSAGLDAPSSEVELIFDKKELISDTQSFEKAMKETYPESYALYLELTDEQKKQIYQDFVLKKRLYNSSVKIISIYLGSH